MSDVTAVPEAPPTDFAQYDAWATAREKAGDPGDLPENSAATPAATPAKAKTAPDSEPEEAQESDSETDEDGLTPQKKSGFTRRVEKLNRKIGERDAAIAARDARIAALEQRQGGNATPAEKPAATAAPVDPNEPIADNFGTYAEYVRALAKYEYHLGEQQKAERVKAEEQKATVAKVAETWQTRLADAKKDRYPDWAETVESVDVPISAVMQDTILESEHGPDLAYYLAKNPDEATRIKALGPLAAARALGKIEAQFEATKSTPETPKPRVSKAPPPPTKVRPAAEASEPDPADFSAWEKWRNAQPGASLRR